jgi:hypothetical protein
VLEPQFEEFKVEGLSVYEESSFDAGIVQHGLHARVGCLPLLRWEFGDDRRNF